MLESKSTAPPLKRQETYIACVWLCGRDDCTSVTPGEHRGDNGWSDCDKCVHTVHVHVKKYRRTG